jgi:hypothetical protein
MATSTMSVADIASEAAKRYCVAMLGRECIEELLDSWGVPAA